MLLRNQADAAKAQQVSKNLAGSRRSCAATDEERDLNDQNAQRVKNLEETIEAVGTASTG